LRIGWLARVIIPAIEAARSVADTDCITHVADRRAIGATRTIGSCVRVTTRRAVDRRGIGADRSVGFATHAVTRRSVGNRSAVTSARAVDRRTIGTH
jgi:hypothetical protein